MVSGTSVSNNGSLLSPVRRDPVIVFITNPAAGAVGVPTPVTLSWSSDLGVSASIDNGVGAVALTGSTIVAGVVATTTWTISVTKLNGSIVTKTVTYTAV